MYLCVPSRKMGPDYPSVLTPISVTKSMDRTTINYVIYHEPEDLENTWVVQTQNGCAPWLLSCRNILQKPHSDLQNRQNPRI